VASGAVRADHRQRHGGAAALWHPPRGAQQPTVDKPFIALTIRVLDLTLPTGSGQKLQNAM